MVRSCTAQVQIYSTGGEDKKNAIEHALYSNGRKIDTDDRRLKHRVVWSGAASRGVDCNDARCISSEYLSLTQEDLITCNRNRPLCESRLYQIRTVKTYAREHTNLLCWWCVNAEKHASSVPRAAVSRR